MKMVQDSGPDSRGFFVPYVDLDGDLLPLGEHNRITDALHESDADTDEEIEAFIQRELEEYGKRKAQAA